MGMDKFTQFTIAFATLFFGTLLIILGCMIFAAPVWFLWNLLVPTIFGLGEITIWQAFGLTILCNLLFGGNMNTQTKIK